MQRETLKIPQKQHGKGDFAGVFGPVWVSQKKEIPISKIVTSKQKEKYRRCLGWGVWGVI